MDNSLYENNYTKYIEPVYGNKRNIIEDNLLLKDDSSATHLYSILDSDRYYFTQN